jgi:hypothetical protein
LEFHPLSKKKVEMKIGGRYAKYFVPVLILACSHSVRAAEELPKTYGGFGIKLTLTGGMIYESTCPNVAVKVRMPEFLRNERHNSPMRESFPALTTDNLTDNPLWHGAGYAHISVAAKRAGLTLFGELIAEHRGASYGVYSMGNIAVLPKFAVSIDSSFGVGREQIGVGGGAGNYDDYRMYEGLAIYNVDVQGYWLYLKWRHLRFAYRHIADLEEGIGLNINDQGDFILSLENIPLSDRLRLDSSVGYFDYIMDTDADKNLPNDGLNISAGLAWNERARLYSQVGMRDVDGGSYRGIKRYADLVGCSVRGGFGRFDFNVIGEYRFYGRLFNQGLYTSGDCFFFRGGQLETPSSRCFFVTTVGRVLYPLDVFYRPFGQWAVYTNYQGRDVQSVIWRTDASFDLPRSCSLFCHLDFNYLDVSNEDPFFYPFYDAGFGWSPFPGTIFTYSYTNRAMNLDKSYPTLYLLGTSTAMITFQGAIAF